MVEVESVVPTNRFLFSVVFIFYFSRRKCYVSAASNALFYGRITHGDRACRRCLVVWFTFYTAPQCTPREREREWMSATLINYIRMCLESLEQFKYALRTTECSASGLVCVLERKRNLYLFYLVSFCLFIYVYLFSLKIKINSMNYLLEIDGFGWLFKSTNHNTEPIGDRREQERRMGEREKTYFWI